MSRSSRKLRRIRRDTKHMRRSMSWQAEYARREAAWAAYAAQAEQSAWQQRQALEYATWWEEQSRRDAPPGWYPDPSTLRQCHQCGAPRDGLAMDTPCRYCSTPQRLRYFDGSAWTEHVRAGMLPWKVAR